MTDATRGKAALITPGFLVATTLVVALFFFWGVSNSLNDVLIPQFRKTFLLSDFASSFVQFATFIGYFLFAIPASLFMRRVILQARWLLMMRRCDPIRWMPRSIFTVATVL